MKSLQNRPSQSPYNFLLDAVCRFGYPEFELAEADSPRKDAPMRKIGDLYASCMDETAVESKGIAPIEPAFERIHKLKNKDELAAEVARLHAEGVPVFFRLVSGPDAKNRM